MDVEDGEVDDEGADAGSLAGVEVADVPGMVWALTAPKTPTAATAAMPAPSVSRFSSRCAASRARIRGSAGLVPSMDSSFGRTS